MPTVPSDELRQQISQPEFDELLEEERQFSKDRTRKRPSLSNLLIRGLVVPEGFNFGDIDLTGTKFEDVELHGCRFQFGTLNEVDFSDALLLGCNIGHCSINGIKFREVLETSFESLSFGGLKLHENIFNRCRFKRCTFSDAILEYVQFEEHYYVQFKENRRFGSAAIRHLSIYQRYKYGILVQRHKRKWFERYSRLEGCTFSGIKRMHYVNFEGALLTDCVLQNVDLAACKNFRFDKTDIRGARLPYRSHDPWSVLVRSYTGSNMLFNLLFLAAYFAPFILKGLALLAAAHFETKFAHMQQNQPVELFDFAKACTALCCVEVPVWRVALGLNTTGWLWIIGLVLLGGRFYQRAL